MYVNIVNVFMYDFFVRFLTKIYWKSLRKPITENVRIAYIKCINFYYPIRYLIDTSYSISYLVNNSYWHNDLLLFKLR